MTVKIPIGGAESKVEQSGERKKKKPRHRINSRAYELNIKCSFSVPGIKGDLGY